MARGQRQPQQPTPVTPEELYATAEEYQRDCQRTRRTFQDTPDDKERMLRLAVVGMAGEVGEVLNIYEKLFFHEHPFNRAALIEELGDVLWYWTLACDFAGASMGEVMAANISKRKTRYPNGWTREASINRVDHSQNHKTGGH